MTRALCLRISLAAVVLATTACDQADPRHAHRPELVIQSRVVFLSEDLRTERAPVPLDRFRLWFPYIVGDLYGSPTAGELVQPVLRRDYSLEIDLNAGHDGLLRSLQRTELSLPQVRIDPAETRIARLIPLALEADGIEQIGAADWIDARSRERLLLVYFDRPSTLKGEVASEKGSLSFDVSAPAAGYVWIRQRDEGGDRTTFVSTEKPPDLALAVVSPTQD